MKKVALLFLVITFSNFLVFGQKPNEPDYLLQKTNTNPPPFPVRTMAEWEEAQALVVTWNGHHTLLTEIIRHAIEEVNVIVITMNEAQTSNTLTAAGIPLDRIFFLQKNLNSIWIRDYGPWSVYANDVEDLTLVDWVYNRPRPYDDILPAAIATAFEWPFYEATAFPNNLIHTGGNHLEDGLTTAFSSDLVQLENPGKTEEEINDLAYKYLGTQRYFKLPRLPYDIIHHLDMHMRLIDEETLLIGAYPEGIADGPAIEANINYIKNNLTTPFGNPYTIIRIPMPPDENGHYPDTQGGNYRTYTNSLIINKSILVPTYEEQYDTTAFRIYESLFPGYKIIGIDCNEIIQSVGAIHCVTKLIGGEDPLLIAHPKLRDTDQIGDYPVEAIIKHKSGLLAAYLYYRIKGDLTFSMVPMYNTNFTTGKFESVIPSVPMGSTVEYYIKAISNSGKEQYRPMVAPDGYFSFEVKVPQSSPKAIIHQNNKEICHEAFVRFTGSYSKNARTYSWEFPGGDPSSSSEANPIVYYQGAGNQSVQLIVTNDLGADTLLLTNAITTRTFTPPYPAEHFDSGIPAHWEVINPDEGSNQWQNISIFSCDTMNSVLKLNNYSGERKAYQKDYFRSGIDLEKYIHTKLVFDIAYTFKPNQKIPDELRINIITCDGHKTTIYDKNQSSLATATPSALPFLPGSCESWRREELDISAYDGTPITIEFESISGAGNNLYLDNIEVKGDRIPNKRPIVFLTSPTTDQTISTNDLPYSLLINATAEDIDGYIEKLILIINQDTVYTFEHPPYEIYHQFPSYGSYTIEAIAYDNEGGIKHSLTKTLHIQPDKIPLETELSIYPIPAEEWLTLQLTSNKVNDLNYSLWSPDGKEVYTHSWHIEEGENKQDVPLSNFPSGMYYLTVNAPELTIIKRVVLVK